MLKVFQSFSGKWSFNRNIVHKVIETPTFSFSNSNESSSSNNNNNISTVIGSASFNLLENNNDIYQYYEEGILKQPDNTTFNISQKYLYKFKDEIITVYFDEKPEPRLFHTLNFDNSTLAKGHHLCGCDTYDAVYQFISPREFKLIYSVVGPKKNYKITTTFSKLSL